MEPAAFLTVLPTALAAVERLVPAARVAPLASFALDDAALPLRVAAPFFAAAERFAFV
jgi:hypothetical protein